MDLASGQRSCPHLMFASVDTPHDKGYCIGNAGASGPTSGSNVPIWHLLVRPCVFGWSNQKLLGPGRISRAGYYDFRDTLIASPNLFCSNLYLHQRHARLHPAPIATSDATDLAAWKPPGPNPDSPVLRKASGKEVFTLEGTLVTSTGAFRSRRLSPIKRYIIPSPLLVVLSSTTHHESAFCQLRYL